jgi:hypothetical protein
MFRDEAEQDMCGALEEMQAIFRHEGEWKLALSLVRERMEKRGMTAREAAEDLGLDPELTNWCATALSGGDGSGT